MPFVKTWWALREQGPTLHSSILLPSNDCRFPNLFLFFSSPWQAEAFRVAQADLSSCEIVSLDYVAQNNSPSQVGAMIRWHIQQGNNFFTVDPQMDERSQVRADRVWEARKTLADIIANRKDSVRAKLPRSDL